MTAQHDLAVGIVIHSEDTKGVLYGSDYVLYADPTDNPTKQNFQIYVGVLFPNGVSTTKAMMYDTPSNGNSGHGVGVVSYKPGMKYTYYLGSAWSKNDVRTLNEWKIRSEETLGALRATLKVTVK